MISGTVNTSAVGVYSVNYNVSDTAGNDAVQVTRTVTVVAPVAPTSEAPSGSGAVSDPYLIASLNNLYWLSQTPSEWGSGKYFTQTADINAAGTTLLDNGSGLSPIGNSSSNFKGVYDGGGHVIDGLVIDLSLIHI